MSGGSVPLRRCHTIGSLLLWSHVQLLHAVYPYQVMGGVKDGEGKRRGIPVIKERRTGVIRPLNIQQMDCVA